MSTCRFGGHVRTPENTYVRPNGERECRDCRRAADEARRDRIREQEAARRAGGARNKYQADWMREVKYPRLMATPEGRWAQRARTIRWKLDARRRRFEQRDVPELSFRQMLDLALSGEGVSESGG